VSALERKGRVLVGLQLPRPARIKPDADRELERKIGSNGGVPGNRLAHQGEGMLKQKLRVLRLIVVQGCSHIFEIGLYQGKIH
jgi:hypothetical protein